MSWWDIFFILLFSTIIKAELSDRPSWWLFGLNDVNICQVRLQYQKIIVNLTNIYDHNNSHQKISLPSMPHYCSPQACVNIDNGQLGFICLNYTNWRFTLVNAAEQQNQLKVEGRMLRYDVRQRTLAVWNGRNIRLFAFNASGQIGPMIRRLKVDLAPATFISDMQVYNGQIKLLINGVVYLLDAESGRLYAEFYTGLRLFPFQTLDNNSTQTAESVRQFCARMAFPALAVMEMFLLLIGAYYFKWQLYSRKTVRFSIGSPNDVSSNSDDPTELPTVFNSLLKKPPIVLKS